MSEYQRRGKSVRQLYNLTHRKLVWPYRRIMFVGVALIVLGVIIYYVAAVTLAFNPPVSLLDSNSGGLLLLLYVLAALGGTILYFAATMVLNFQARVILAFVNLYSQLHTRYRLRPHLRLKKINAGLHVLASSFQKLPERMRTSHPAVIAAAGHVAASAVEWQHRVSTEPTHEWRGDLERWIELGLNDYLDERWVNISDTPSLEFVLQTSRARRIGLGVAGAVLLFGALGLLVWLSAYDSPALGAVSLVLPVVFGVAFILFKRANLLAEELKDAQEFGKNMLPEG